MSKGGAKQSGLVGVGQGGRAADQDALRRLNWPFQNLIPGHYRCLLIDPPWKFSAGTKGRPQHYRRMTDAEIAALPIAELAHPDGCWVFVWTTSPKNHHAHEICGAGRFKRNGKMVFQGWGAKYSGRAFVWVKTHRKLRHDQMSLFVSPQHIHKGHGYTTRKNAEDVLLFKFGKPARLRKDIHEIIFSPPREHSRKPVEVMERIEAYCGGPRAELFSRESRSGWDVFGDEAGKFDEAAE